MARSCPCGERLPAAAVSGAGRRARRAAGAAGAVPQRSPPQERGWGRGQRPRIAGGSGAARPGCARCPPRGDTRPSEPRERGGTAACGSRPWWESQDSGERAGCAREVFKNPTDATVNALKEFKRLYGKSGVRFPLKHRFSGDLFDG